MIEALAGVILFLLGYAFCEYQNRKIKQDTENETTVDLSVEEMMEAKRQEAQIKAFHTMMNYDETTAYSGGMTDE
jgi:hypothetical protein